MNKIVLLFLATISVVVVLSYSDKSSNNRHVGDVHNAETTNASSAIRQSEATNGESPGIDINVSDQDVKLVSDVNKSGDQLNPSDQEMTETELADLADAHFIEKANWENSGFHKVSSVIETYYWAMREGNLSQWVECMSPREMKTWQSIVKGRSNAIVAQHVKSVEETRGYKIVSSVRFNDKDSIKYIMSVTHIMETGEKAVERFAILRIGAEWKICGEQGRLNYEHHSPEISKYDSLTKP